MLFIDADSCRRVSIIFFYRKVTAEFNHYPASFACQVHFFDIKAK